MSAFEAIANDPEAAGPLRDVPPPTRLVHYLARFALFDPRADSGSLKVAELGKGAGLWAVAAGSSSPRIQAHAIVADPTLADRMPKLLSRRGVRLTCDYKVGVIEALPLATNSIDFVICNDGLLAATALPGLREMARVLKLNGRLLIGVDNEISLISGLLQDAREGRLGALLDRLDQLFRLAGRRAGVLAEFGRSDVVERPRTGNLGNIRRLPTDGALGFNASGT